LKPKILLATTTRWLAPARLAIALANVGCEVESVCPRGNLVEKTSVVRRTYRYRAMTPLRSFVTAIDESKPDLVIPCEDLATLHLHEIYCLGQNAGEATQTRTLIERSLGAPSSFSIVFARAALMTLARNEGVLVPATEAVATAEDLQHVIARLGYPLILKTDATSGGFGVRIVNTLREAERAMREIRSPPDVTRVLKWAIGSGDYTLVRSCMLRKQSVVSAQEFVSGQEATSAVACWGGKVLASVHFRVMRKQYALGPSTVLRVLAHPDMTSAEEKLVGKLGLSGLYGFDYILEEETGRPYLIEMNPRATQVCHLAMGTGHDLVEALYAALSSGSIRDTLPVTDNGTIALFPQELQRDPASEYLFSAYHDIPTEEPGLVRACMARLPQNRFWAPTQKWLRSLVNGTG
jgi:glutathione synthase/RimK-type ligase-like ATP-grasp enzyme